MTRTLTMIVILAALAASCNKNTDAPAPADTGAKAPPKTGLALGDPKLVERFEAVLTGCEVSDRGIARKCKDPKLLIELQRTEAVDDKATLQTYCQALQDERPKVVELALTRIAVVGQPQRAARADDKVYQCLLGELEKAKKLRAVSILSRVSTHVAAALAKEATLFALLPKLKNRTAEIAVYNSLWPNGRLRVFPRLATVLKEKNDMRIVGAVVRGFGRLPPKEDNERKQVCLVLLPLMTHDENVTVASTAAYRVSHTCPDKTDEVLAAAEQMQKKQALDQTFAAALGDWGRPPEFKWTAKQKRRAVKLLKVVVNSDKFSPATRAAALRALNSHDPKLGKRLAKQHSKDSTPNFLRRAADQILGKGRLSPPPGVRRGKMSPRDKAKLKERLRLRHSKMRGGKMPGSKMPSTKLRIKK